MLTFFFFPALDICLQTKIGSQLAVGRTVCEVLLTSECLDLKNPSLKMLPYFFCPVFNYSAIKM